MYPVIIKYIVVNYYFSIKIVCFLNEFKGDDLYLLICFKFNQNNQNLYYLLNEDENFILTNFIYRTFSSVYILRVKFKKFLEVLEDEDYI